jgi:hypothetical protein
MLIIVVSDEPDVDDRLGEALTTLTGRHDILWAMVPDMPAAGPDSVDGYDVATGRFVLNGSDLGSRVVAAYRRAEHTRRNRLTAFLTAHAIPHATIAGSTEIRRELVRLTGVAARAR